MGYADLTDHHLATHSNPLSGTRVLNWPPTEAAGGVREEAGGEAVRLSRG